mmetsp:Transcript_145043/g.251844  ORF Transcript_145043/g.251844 Transcript_145043/m.251844 type:complete len:615 (-) Transcript_145043:66-1910(-)
MTEKEKAAEAKKKGNDAFTAKNYKEAIKHFTEAISHDPNDHVFYSNRSACYASLEDYEKALSDGEKCVELKPDWHKGYARRGLAEFFLERYDTAAETYQAGLKLAPEDQALKEGLRKAMDAKYDVPGARQPRAGERINMADFNAGSLAVAAAKNPKIKGYLQDPALMKKVNVLMSLSSMPGDQVQESLLQQMLSDDPRVLEIYFAAMGIQIDTSQLRPRERPASADSAASQAKPAAAAGQSSAAASASTEAPAAAPAEESRKRKAEEAFPEAKEEASKAEPNEAESFKAQGNALYKKRKFSEALEMYDKAIEKEPNDLIYYNNKCAVWIEMGPEYYPKVLTTCQDLVDRRYEINGSNSGGASFEKVAKVYCRMASVYEKQKEYDKAIEMYNKALTEDNSRHTRNALREAERAKDKYEKERYLDSGKAEEHRERGNECFKNKDWVGAKSEYDEAVKRNPRDAKLYSNRAAALTKLLAYPDALRDLDECLKLDPKFVKAYSRKGAAHFFMKEYHKALEAYDKGLAIEPGNEECQRGRDQVRAKILETQHSDEVDEEQIRHAMADPEIQQILKDPQINMFLKQMNENPAEATQAMRKDAKLQNAVSKLAAAGIVRVR